ncbi:OprO/OprP family phosphate-selective porin [Dyella flagellata]|uniref:Porin n=1 Tax=Dyella flagellata TaxID=1867833 RepID=A0ABQ5XA75_9GAMM|nr:porin [Dyella flagellata]GLQ87531.1 porin [Dyella flagellata]
MPRRSKLAFAVSACGASALLAVLTPATARAGGDDWLYHWPTLIKTSDGTELGLVLRYQYDVNDFSHDDNKFADAHTNRRKYLGFYLKKPGVYDATVYYDFQSKQWQDVFARLQSRAVLGDDYGALRFGQSKTPVSFEGVTTSTQTTFIELALPSQAVYENRRVGVDWAIQRPHWLASLGYYGKSLTGKNRGHTLAARAAWVPIHEAATVLHLGIAASQEHPYGLVNALGVQQPATASFKTTPEAGLTGVNLISSGTLAGVNHINRLGLEEVWIAGPWSVQGEYLRAQTRFDLPKPHYNLDGYYVFGSWVLTGESRQYHDGNVSNVIPTREWGAVELALRYSELNLNDGRVLGGREHDWTAGANWYIGSHLRLQANYIRAFSNRRGLVVDPRIFELRAEIFL